MSSNPSTEAKKTVTKNLLFGEVMKQQLQENYSRLTSPKETTIVTRAVTGNLERKYKVFKEIGKISGKGIIKAANAHSLLHYGRKARNDKICNAIKTCMTHKCNVCNSPGRCNSPGVG